MANNRNFEKEITTIYTFGKRYKELIDDLNYSLKYNKTRKINVYLVQIEEIDYFMKIYIKLKQFYEDNYTQRVMSKSIEKYIKETTKLKKITKIIKFNNPLDLQNILEKDRKFYLINFSILELLAIDKIKNDKDNLFINCTINNNIISLIFNNESINFKINNFIIEKSSFIEIKSNRNPINPEDKNIHKKKVERLTQENQIINKSNQNKKLDEKSLKILELLIHLFFYYKEINENIQLSFNQSVIQSKKLVYLIDKDWINEFQNFFGYDTLTLEINKQSEDFKDKIKYNDDSGLRDYKIGEEIINSIIGKLPENYVEKIQINGLSDKAIFEKEVTLKEKSNNKNIQYLVNFKIINNDLFSILSYLKYPISKKMLKADCYFLKNKKLLIQFDDKMNKINDEIGVIEDNIFNPEFVIQRTESSNYLDSLKSFINNDFSNFLLTDDQIKIPNIENPNESSGQCYKICDEKMSHLNKDSCNQSTTCNDSSNLNNITENNKRKEEINNINNKKDEDNFESKIENVVKILLMMHLFEKNLLEQLNKEYNKQDANHNIFNGSCYLINKNWIESYKSFYLYDKLLNHLNEKHYEIKKLNEKYLQRKIITEFVTAYKSNFSENYRNNQKKHIEIQGIKGYPVPSLLTFKNEKYNFIYPTDFTIINEEIFSLLVENQEKNNDQKDLLNLIFTDYIINNKKMTIKIKTKVNDQKKYNLLIGYINKNNCFSSELLIHYENNKKEFESEFKQLLKEQNNIYVKNNDNLPNDVYNNGKFIGIIFSFNSSNELEEIPKKNILNEQKSDIINQEKNLENDGKNNGTDTETINITNNSENNEMNSRIDNITNNAPNNLTNNNTINETNVVTNISEINRKGNGTCNTIENIDNNKISKTEDNVTNNETVSQTNNELINAKSNRANNETGNEDNNFKNSLTHNEKKNTANIGLNNDDNKNIQESVENLIKILLNIYLFNLKLKQKIKFSDDFSEEKIESNGYLINEKILNKFKEFYLFDLIVNNFIDNEITDLMALKDDNSIINDLLTKVKNNIEIMDKLNEIGKNEKQFNKELEKEENFKLHYQTIDEVFKYPYDFNIVSEELLQKLIPDNIFNIIDDQKCEYLINQGKFIIRQKFNEVNSNSTSLNLFNYNYNIDSNCYKFETILNYTNQDILSNHFKELKKKKFSEFIYNEINGEQKNANKNCNLNFRIICAKGNDGSNENINKNIENEVSSNLEDTLAKNESDNYNNHTTPGYINQSNGDTNEPVMKDIHFNETNNIKNNNNQNNSLAIDKSHYFNIYKNNHLEFLIRFNYFCRKLSSLSKVKLSNNQQNEKFYLINETLINKYKTFYNYKEIIKTLYENKKIKNLLNVYEKNDFLNNNTMIDECMKKLMEIFPKENINNISEDDFKNFLNELKDPNFYKPNIHEINVDNGLKKISYFKNSIIINERSLKLLSNIADDNLRNVQEFYEIKNYLIDDNKFIFTTNDNVNNFINIGQIDKDNIFKVEFVLNIYQKKDVQPFLSSFEKNGFKKFYNSLIFNDKLADLKEVNGYVYKFENNIININGNNLNSFNDKINVNDKLKKQNKTEKAKLKVKNNQFEKTDQKTANNSRNNVANLKANLINEDLKNLLMIYIYNEKIKDKINQNLYSNWDCNSNKIDNSFLINYEWFEKLIKFNNMENIYSFLLKNIKQIKYVINNNNSEDNILKEIVSKIGKTLIEQIKRNKNYNDIKNNKLFNASEKYIQIRKNEKKIFYDRFLLINNEISQKLYKEFGIYPSNQVNDVLIGDGKIFLIINSQYQHSIQVSSYKENFYQNELVLIYIYNFQLNDNIQKIISERYNNYINNHLIFQSDNDIISPIFDNKYRIIGYGFRNSHNQIDFTNNLINEHLLKLIKYYFYGKQLKMQLESGKTGKGTLYLINEKWIINYKDHFDYQNLIKELQINPIVKQVIENLRPNSDLSNMLNDKKLALIIKNMSNNFNKFFNQNETSYQNNEEISPELGSYNYLNKQKQQSTLFYYNNFELINLNYFILDSNYNQSGNHNNFAECYFIDGLVMFKLPSNVTGIFQKTVFEVGEINENNIFFPKYFLIYSYEGLFVEHINNTLNNIGYIKCYFDSLQLKKSEGLPLCDLNNENKEFCMIYKFCEENNNNQIDNIHNDEQINVRSNSNDNNNNINNINFSNNNCGNNNNFSCIYNFGNTNFSYCFNNNISTNPNSYGHNEEFVNQDKPNMTIRKDFTGAQLIGLKNVGATCYMNATLQCLCQIEKLVNYFKYKTNSINQIMSKNNLEYKETLTYSFKYLIENLWPSKLEYITNNYTYKNSNNSYFSPDKFKEKISKMNPLFRGIQANDAKDLVNFIIMTLHEELNKVKPPQITNAPQLDQTNQVLMLTNFAQKFAKENQSIISDIFYAMNGSSIQCSRCNIIKYTYEAYFFIIFPLEEVRKFKINFLQQQYMQNNQNLSYNPILYQQGLMAYQNIDTVNIIDCFNFNSQLEYMTGENSMFCNNCQQQLPFLRQPFLVTGPDVLIIVLNRGKGIEFNVKLEFCEYLYLQNYIQKQNTGVNYKLIGVVTHMGLSGASGHFIACCRSPIDDHWYKYNDDLVTPINDVKQEIIDYAMPYILFYQKC